MGENHHSAAPQKASASFSMARFHRLARRAAAIPAPNQRSPHQNRSLAHHDQG